MSIQKIPIFFLLFFLSLVIGSLGPSLCFAVDPIQVVVQGLEGDEQKNVQAALALPPGLVRDGIVDERWLDYYLKQIPQKVSQALEPFGYYDSKVTVARQKTEEGVEKLSVQVVRGEPIRISEMKIAMQGPGEGEKSLQALFKTFPLREGGVLNQIHYEKAKGEIRDKAQELGYLDADFSVHRIEIFRTEFKARIELILDTGPQYRFGKVTFTGAPLFPDEFLKRFLTFRSGEVFSYAKLGTTQFNLLNSDRFKEVLMVAEKEKAEDHQVPIEVRLTPSKPKRLRPGIGYSSDEGPIGSLLYQDVNFHGWGHELGSELSLSKVRRALVTRYVIPGQRSTEPSAYSLTGQKEGESYTAFRLGFEQQLVKTYNSWSIYPEIEHARSLGKGMVGSVYLQARHEEDKIADQTEISNLLMPGLRFSQRRYDSLIRPTRGFRYSLESRGAAKFLGSNTTFFQQLFDADVIVPLPGRIYLFPRLQLGFTLQPDPVTDLPATIRFFAGGDRSVRGYTYQSLGPKDSAGRVIGGRHLLVANLELEKAIGKSWGLAVFYDFGNSFNSFRQMDLAQAVGIGGRYYSAVGPIRVDIARQLNVLHPGFQLHITVGFYL